MLGCCTHFLVQAVPKRCHNVSFGTGCEFLSPQTMFFEGLVRIGNNSFFSAEGGAISVRAGTAFNMSAHINASLGGQIRIGESCLVGPNVVMRTAGHRFDDPRVPIREQVHIFGDINIEDNVWIGASAVVLGEGPYWYGCGNWGRCCSY